MTSSSRITDYLGVGVAASRSAAPTLSPGALGLYYATDTSAWSVWNGSSWIAAPLPPIDASIQVNNGTIGVAHQGTITVSTTTTTINATGVTSMLVNGKATGGTTTVTINGGYVGQMLRVDHKQGATAEVVLFDTSVAIGTVGSFTATPTASLRDCLQFENLDGTHWALHAISSGFSF